MLKVDGSLDHIPARRGHVVVLYESINQPQVNIPGYGVAPTGAFILGTQNDRGAFTVFVYLHQPQTSAVLIYVSEPRSLGAEQLRREELEAIQFLESMGFMVDDVQFAQLSPAQQEAVIERVPLFWPPARGVVSGRRVEGHQLLGSAPGSERAAPALGPVVTGRPEGPDPASRPSGDEAAAGPSSPGPVGGLGPMSSGPCGASGPLLDIPPPLTLSGAQVTAPLGRGLAAATSGEHPRPTVELEAHRAEALARIGRLLGTFGLLLAVAGSSARCASSPEVGERVQQLEVDLGNQELARTEWAEALKHYQVVLEANAKHGAANRGAGLAYFGLGRYEQAEAHLRRAVASDPKWSEPKNELAVLLIETDRCEEARTLLVQVLDDIFYPTHHFAEHNLARAEACSGNPEAAVARLERLTERRPKFCRAYLTASELAEAARLREATVEACESFRENCELDEEIGPKIAPHLSAACHLRRGRAYLALGDVESARSAFQRCVGADSTGSTCRDALGLLPP